MGSLDGNVVATGAHVCGRVGTAARLFAAEDATVAVTEEPMIRA
ncbi:MAG: hypothetical protein WBM50_15135 [Acidimicrobiales bacterium]